MTRRARTAAVLLTSAAFAGLAGYGMYRGLSSIAVREVETTSYQVVVAATALSTGVLLQPADVMLVSWPASHPVADGYTDVKDVINRGLMTSLLANEPITAGRLAPIAAGGGLTPSIRTGMRAMSVKVNEVIGVAGFVVPGTRVDVLVTMRRGSDDTMTRTVVTNAQVLTAGTRADQEQAGKEDGKPIPSTVVTLVVTPADAERIALAQSQGQIMLALRNPLDTATAETPGIGTAALLGVEPMPAPVATAGAPRASAPPAPPVRASYSVEVIRATKRTEVELK